MRPSWDQYFMDIAHLVKTRSTCLRRQVGAVAVSKEHRILGTGYNGPLPGTPHCDQVGCLRQQLGIGSDYACFAELFDDTLGYKVNQLGAGLPEHMRPFVKEMPSAVELDEKVGLIILLTQGRLVQPRHADMEPLTAVRLEAEILYNRIPNALLLTILFFVIVGGGMLVWRARRPGSSGTPERSGK